MAPSADDVAKYRDHVRISVRAVLLPHKSGVRMGQFRRDYKEMVGEDVIDHRKLGFGSMLDMLRSWPDVVAVLGSPNDVILKAVDTQATAHITKMVQKQKDTPRDKQLQQQQRQRNQHAWQEDIKNRARTRVLPAEEIDKIRRVVKMLRLKDARLEEFETCYVRVNRESVPYARYGFSSLRDLLFAHPELVSVHQIANDVFIRPTRMYQDMWNEEEKAAAASGRNARTTCKSVFGDDKICLCLQSPVDFQPTWPRFARHWPAAATLRVRRRPRRRRRRRTRRRLRRPRRVRVRSLLTRRPTTADTSSARPSRTTSSVSWKRIRTGSRYTR